MIMVLSRIYSSAESAVESIKEWKGIKLQKKTKKHKDTFKLLKFIISISSLLFFLFSASALNAQSSTTISGKVTDEHGKPLPYVNVFLLNKTDGAMTNEQGKFTFRTKTKGKATLVATMIGYKKYEMKLNFSGNSNLSGIEITLEQKMIKLDEAIVMGSSFGSAKGNGVVIKAMDVMTTPGGAADIFQSLKTMPGLTQVSESAQLYVRGGDPTETVTLIDQAPVYHPYTLESSYGGLFSNLNTAAVKSMYFSSGGFSAKYGNVLSGVLDIGTKNLPLSRTFNFGISMAAASLDGEIPLVEDKLGFRFYAQQSYTRPIMWLNGALDAFTTTPISKNINAALIYKYSKTGRLKLFGLFADDKQGVNVDRAEYDGTFNGNSSSNLVNLQLTDIVLSDIVIKSSISFNAYKNIWKFGILDLTKKDNVFQIRTDADKIVSSKLQISAGAVFESRTQHFLGVIPKESYNIRTNSPGKVLDESLLWNRIGAYAEIKVSDLFALPDLFAIAGVRTDYVPALNSNSFDPRFGIGYKINNKSTFKLGWGIFHQIPDARLFSKKYGNPNLKSMKAAHYVASYDYKIDNVNSFRIEAYYKDYNNLPLEDKKLNYTSNGSGFAEGVDLILKGKLPFGLKGWISYGFINTKRKWMSDETLTNSDFDITHNLSIVAKYNFSSMWQIGITFKYATGRPFTPVISAVYLPNQNIFKPIYGGSNSERYPDYKRLDFRITHLNQLFGKYFSVFYIETLNILNFNNLFGYSYNKNYSERNVIKSYFGRLTIVLGTSITF